MINSSRTSRGGEKVAYLLRRTHLSPHRLLPLAHLLLTGIAASAVVLTGCRTVGPERLPLDRFDYMTAIAESNKQLMLSNLVRIRYSDTPVFLDVISVINQYEVGGSVSAGATAGSGTVGDGVSFNGAVRYRERPTITYAPVSGAKFTRSLLSPIPPPALLSLLQAGWRVDFLFRVAVRSINGVQNESRSPWLAGSSSPDFRPLVEALARIQHAGALGARVKRGAQPPVAELIFREPREEPIRDDLRFVRQVLGLAPGVNKFRITADSFPKDDREIAMLPRSLLEVLTELAFDVEVPPGHERRVTQRDRSQSGGVGSMIRIESSQGAYPDAAFTVIRYADTWFWINEDDSPSKRMLYFLQLLLSLAETGPAPPSPLVTVPIN